MKPTNLLEKNTSAAAAAAVAAKYAKKSLATLLQLLHSQQTEFKGNFHQMAQPRHLAIF